MIPNELKALKGWLLWKLIRVPGEPKPRKVPCYVDGTQRSGKQGSPHDRERWATYEMASAVLAEDIAGKFAGLGFALSPEWGVVGLDFDACVDAAGNVDAAVMDVIDGTYSEFSPSGTGIHAFLTGKLPDKKSRADGSTWGFETFCEKGFLTMTGRPTPACELVGWDTLDHVNGAVTELFEARFGASAIHAPRGGDLVVPETPPEDLSDEKLRDLLNWHDPDAPYIGSNISEGSWLHVGMALHHETGGEARGLALWNEHSSRGTKYSGSALLEAKWDSFGRKEGSSTTVRWLRLVAEARSNGLAIDDSAFAVLEDARPPVQAAEWEPIPDMTTPTAVDATIVADMQLVAKLPPPPEAPLPAVRRRGIPEAHHLCSDQANAQRLKDSFGALVLVAAGKWHVWDGKRWIADEADVYRYGCRLSEIVRAEAKVWRGKAGKAVAEGDGPEAAKCGGIAEALGKWSLKCEMKGTIEAAIGLARKMLTVDVDALDRDPWALNCENGVVDLRTGLLRRHNPSEYITKLVPLRYLPDAGCPTWEQVLSEITCEETLGVGERPMMAFLQRWAGYCLTGDTREQCFAVHWGGGGNGKSTVIDMLAQTQGEYGMTAAPGLLAAVKGERHPTEIASLMGRRMVTAHEHGENVVLREDFIKQATGGDRLTARHMREDFFEFTPVHKLQLLTNHKPQIKGQDQGIWRRVLLIPYLMSWGTAEQVASGKALRVKDMTTPLRLKNELEGVLAWRVRGAVAWAQEGLCAPAAVKAAGDAYKREQDRVGQFVEECCELGVEFAEALTESGMSAHGGLYPSYVSWCKDAGIFAVSKIRFADDILRVVPKGEIVVRKTPSEGGKRKDVRIVRGVRLLAE